LIDWVGNEPIAEKTYTAKIRYRQADQECTIEEYGTTKKVYFKNPQRAIASGQICVIYE
jgi:tRNA-specific 2-thiouridylase